MEPIQAIKNDVDGLKKWQGVADHRISSLEKQRAYDIKQVIRIETELNQVDRKVSRIEGGIEYLKWSIPISLLIATGIGSVIAWVISL
jgi:hypothetical protein